MRLVKRLGLATTDLRDQFSRGVIVVFGLFSPVASAEPVLSILTQTQRLDAALVQEFEASRKLSVRVEFVSSSLDYESKIRSLPHNWDLVIADEQRLVNLSLSKILKNLPEGVSVPPDVPGLERRARANPDGRTHLNLMADPLGIMFLKKTLTSPGPVSWDWIVNPVSNPLWRSRLALFADERMNLLTAAVATGLKFPVEQMHDAQKVNDWLTQAQLQGRPYSLPSVIPAFLARKIAVGVAWQSDFIQASRYVKNLSFTVPVQGTYFERVGIGLVSDCRNETAALDFIRFIYEKRDVLAQRRGLLPLHAQDFQSSPVSGWRVFSDDVPRLKELTTTLHRLKKEKESRNSRSR
ncbi:MAG: hypothetical protein RI953_171 [Pseudomonadota bacterium]|jgi:spermidine/putrescine-binding protein